MNRYGEFDNPANVPPIMDVRFAGWDRREPTQNQIWKLGKLLATEGVDPAELYGEGYSGLGRLSRWAMSWGITYLDAAQEARHVESTRQYIERERQRVEEETLKRNMAMILRGVRRG